MWDICVDQEIFSEYIIGDILEILVEVLRGYLYLYVKRLEEMIRLVNILGEQQMLLMVQLYGFIFIMCF